MKCFRAFSVFTLAIYEGHDLFPALLQLLLLHRTVRITPFQFIGKHLFVWSQPIPCKSDVDQRLGDQHRDVGNGLTAATLVDSLRLERCRFWQLAAQVWLCNKCVKIKLVSNEILDNQDVHFLGPRQGFNFPRENLRPVFVLAENWGPKF